MRYKVGYPLECGKRIAVFDLKDSVFPEKRKVLTLLTASQLSYSDQCLTKRIEARCSLVHPALPPILDIAFRGKNPGLVTEYLDLPQLEGLIGKISLDKAMRIALVLTDLVHQLHRRGHSIGYLNPHKIFIGRNNDPVLNFLLSREKNSSINVSDYSMRYAAPEYLKTGAPSSAADCYSLGMILYLLFAGIQPFFETAPGELRLKKERILPAPLNTMNPLISDGIASVIGFLIHPDPKQRPRAHELLSELRSKISNFKTSQFALTTGIIGRESEISEFHRILRDQEEKARIVLIRGNPGVGKSKLSEYFQIASSLKGYRVHTLHGEGNDPGILQPGRNKNNKILLRVKDYDVEAFSSLPSLSKMATGRILVLIEATNNLDPQTLQLIKTKIPVTEMRVSDFHLKLLDKHKTSSLVESLLADKSSFYYYQKTVGVSCGNPLFISAFLKFLRDSGKLFSEDETWCWHHWEFPGDGLPEEIEKNVLKQMETLAPQQMKVLRLLAICNQEIPLCWITEIVQNPLACLNETIQRLEESGLVDVQNKPDHSTIKISHTWIAGTLRDRMSLQEKKDLHGMIAYVLEKAFLREHHLPLLFDLCRHYINSNTPAKAAGYLPRSITYLIKNSSFHHALCLFESALSLEMILINIQANWLTYIKLLLKTGNERKCRDFLHELPKFPLNKVILFRLGYLLESLDLQSKEICPHLADSIDEVFSRASCQSLLKVSQNQTSVLPGSPDSLNVHFRRFSHPSIQEKTRYYHQLFRMYHEQGQFALALHYEVRAFRLSLSIGKKGVAARRLLNLSALILSRDQVKRASLWLKYCLKMAEETGDLKTRLEAEIYLTMLDRNVGHHIKAEFNLERIGSINQKCCGSRRILCLLLLEEAKNLNGRARHENALKKLMDLNRLLEKSSDSVIKSESFLLEARIWHARKRFRKALELLDKVKKCPASIHHNFAARELLLRLRISLDRQDMDNADLAIKKLISRKVFLSPRNLIKTRILQGEFSLSKKDLQRAGAFIYDAFRISEKHSFTPLIAESCLIKARWMAAKMNFQQALRYSCQASRLASKTDRPELKLLSHLTREMVCEGNPANGFISLPAISEIKPARSCHSSIKKSITRRQAYQIKTRHFVAFVKNEQNLGKITRQMLSIIQETFPEANARLYRGKNGAAMLNHSNQAGSPQKIEDYRGKCNQFPELRTGIVSSSSSVLFPIGSSSIRYGILSVDFPGKTFVSESDYDFIKLLSDISTSYLNIQEKSPASARNYFGKILELQDGRVIIGESPCIQEVLKTLINVADMETTVLIQGESGTGKELLARALHDFSHRKSGPFIPLNCSTLPAELVENELFGHIRGSYTGADSTRAGLFESSAGGTVFLDEISTLPLSLQPRLLRVLENKTVRPLGASQEKHLDIRVVAATNQDLQALAQKGEFRFDLFQRLNAFSIKIPPLRQRKSDIPEICKNYIYKHRSKSHKALSDQAVEKLCRYDYPGNVRELLNIMENLLCFSSSRIISEADVTKHIPSLEQNSDDLANKSAASDILGEISQGKLDFWEGVRDPFIRRDINRDEVRRIISEGLKSCNGSYKSLLQLFNLKPGEYKKLLSFLEHHDCKVDFREFRNPDNHRN